MARGRSGEPLQRALESAMRDAGSLRRAAVLLNERAVPSPLGGLWTASILESMLRSKIDGTPGAAKR